jgi:hypothetical protein
MPAETLDILEAAHFDAVQVKAIAKAIDCALDARKAVTRPELDAALARQQTELVKRMFGLVAAQATVVLGGVWFMVSK